MIANVCGTCGKDIRSPEDQRGRQMKCPVCGDAFIVGAAAPVEEEVSYGVAGVARAAAAAEPPPAKSKSGKKASAKPAKPVPAANLPPGKAECPTCGELTPDDRDQCAYCGDLLAR